MPQFTVYIEEGVENGKTACVLGTYATLGEATQRLHAAEFSHPNSAVWIEDEKGRGLQREGILFHDPLPREDLVPPDPDPDLSYIPLDPEEDDLPLNPGDDFYVCQPNLYDPLYEQGSEDVLEEIRDTCPHYWQKQADGLFHCIHGCGVPPHEPHPGETND